MLIALAIKLTSRGPVFFIQDRYGLNGKKIGVFKFRSMTTADNGANVQQATRHDKRITRLGAVLRSTSLDELPQLFNVLLGDMSIVGPRPHAVAHNEAYRALIHGYMLRHKVKPGITGWAQVNGFRGETDTEDKMRARIEFDLEYIENWDLRWDLEIILRTVFTAWRQPNAY
jgi:putative colanic acid biosynthesis UDP-glucose lipid carrier transferase